jgi:hypothetical protein
MDIDFAHLVRPALVLAAAAVLAGGAAVAGAAEPPVPSADPAGDPPVVDVLMLYTPTAKQETGGEAALRGIAERGATYTNQAFVNSQANVRTRVVAVLPAPDYNPEGKEDVVAAYDYLTDAPQSAGSLRGAHKADVVGLLASETGAFAVAPGPPLPTESPGAGRMMLLDQAMTNAEPDTFAHELGHLLGLLHDGEWEGDEYEFARGYVAPSMKWRDIMAYESRCEAVGKKCPLIPYFSNPRLTYEGEQLGVPKGQPGEADAVSMLNESGPIVAAYR